MSALEALFLVSCLALTTSAATHRKTLKQKQGSKHVLRKEHGSATSLIPFRKLFPMTDRPTNKPTDMRGNREDKLAKSSQMKRPCCVWCGGSKAGRVEGVREEVEKI